MESGEIKESRRMLDWQKIRRTLSENESAQRDNLSMHGFVMSRTQSDQSGITEKDWSIASRLFDAKRHLLKGDAGRAVEELYGATVGDIIPCEEIAQALYDEAAAELRDDFPKNKTADEKKAEIAPFMDMYRRALVKAQTKRVVELGDFLFWKEAGHK